MLFSHFSDRGFYIRATKQASRGTVLKFLGEHSGIYISHLEYSILNTKYF
jgi:hypothetical protein